MLGHMCTAFDLLSEEINVPSAAGSLWCIAMRFHLVY